MKTIFCKRIVLLVIAFFCASCERAEKKPETVRVKKDRAITISNKTGSPIAVYQVNVAESGVEIDKGTFPGDSFSIKIKDAFVNDRRLEVVLIDQSKRIYAKTFDVPLEGNTDTPITTNDRKTEGLLKDKWKDLVDYLNKNK